MNENIHQELIKLQDELSKLRTAVDQIDMAKQASAKAVDSAEHVTDIAQRIANDYQQLADKTEQLVVKIDEINFPERLNRIEQNITNDFKRGIDDLSVMIGKKFTEVQKNINDKTTALYLLQKKTGKWNILLISFALAVLLGMFIYSLLLG